MTGWLQLAMLADAMQPHEVIRTGGSGELEGRTHGRETNELMHKHHGQVVQCVAPGMCLAQSSLMHVVVVTPATGVFPKIGDPNIVGSLF